MGEMQEIVLAFATVLAGGLGYGLMQFIKWALAENGVIMEGRLAVNVTLGVSAVLGLASTYLGFVSLNIPAPTTVEGWAGLVIQGALGVMGAATLIYKNIRDKKE